MFRLYAKKVVLEVNQREIVTSNSVNVYQCQFKFDNSWDGLEKTAVFKAGDISISVLLDDSGACNIPWEVFQDAKRTLYAGVYGTKNDNVVLPTIWANCGEIKPGVTQGENTQPPTPDVYSQILQVAKDAEDVAQSVRDDADSGRFNGEQGPTGPQGYTYTPAVSEEGVISWTNDGSLPNPSPVNITGPQGETGETPDIIAGTVETLEPGQDATAEITGETPNLVLNLGIPKGQPGQDAPQIDDDVVSATNPWSSLKIVDTLAPPFSSSGAIVTCNPVAGYPLHVVSQIVPVQEGEGDPSPENVRPISGWTEATLTHNDTPITLPFGQTVYGGTLDWTTGVLTVDWIYLRLTSSMDIRSYSYSGSSGIFVNNILDDNYNRTDGFCSHSRIILLGENPSILPGALMWIGSANKSIYWIRILDELGFSTIEEFKSWLDEQNVYVAYKSNSQTSVQLTAQEILALSGTNTIYTDTGDTTVSGRADPNTIIQSLSQRIAALESAAVQTQTGG